MKMDTRVKMRPGEYVFHPVKLENVIPGKKYVDKLPEIKIEVTKLLSDRGSTCLVYEGLILSNQRKVIIKEFYPKSEKNVWAIERNEKDQKLSIPNMVWGVKSDKPTEIIRRFNQFIRSGQWQKKFYSEQFLEIAVELQCIAMYGDSYYIISDYHQGNSLSEKVTMFSSLRDKIHLFQYLTDVMAVLADEGYLFLDICADNFLIIQQTETRYQIRLFDFDSIVDLKNLKDIHDGREVIFYHEEYASGELHRFADKVKSGNADFDNLKSSYLTEREMIYSMGVLFFEILFNRKPQEAEILVNTEASKLCEDLSGKYKISMDVAKMLVQILKKMLEEHSSRCDKLSTILEELNRFADELHYDTYLSRKRVVEANATLVAYNILQKYPMFYYSDESDCGEKLLKTAIVGKHIMRTGILSALISTGQMLNSRLEISIVADDAREFWEDYVSKNKNEVLKRTVIVSENGKVFLDNVDEQLVNRPLAYIDLNTDSTSVLKLYKGNNIRYFITFGNVSQTFEELKGIDTDRMFIACVQEKQLRETELNKNIDIQWLSGHIYDEVYSEDMYRKQIYKMGFMAHAYYYGCMNPDSKKDLVELEKEYEKDIYSRLSSERAALHGIYKMASIGVDPNKPGRFRQYYEKITDQKNGDVLVESLGWVEHLSWTAYMLTAGHQPASTDELDLYAYRDGNDWKLKKNPDRIRHPLIAASRPQRGITDNGWEDISKEEEERLDPLDKVSLAIYRWYCSKKDSIKDRFETALSDYEWFQDSSNIELFRAMQDTGIECIKHMGELQNNQNTEYIDAWDKAVKNMAFYIKTELKEDTREGRIMKKFLGELKEIMKPVVDSYKNRDFKQNDRDIVYSVLDIIAV